MTITEASRKFELSADTLRYYERIGLIPSVNRTQGGVRDYTERDCRWVEFAKCMRSAGLPVEALIGYVTLFQQGDTTSEARRQILIEQRKLLTAKMAVMQKTLERLDTKIERYEQLVVPAEKRLKKQEN